MSKRKNEAIKFEMMLNALFGIPDHKRRIKDIENNRKHKPKSQK